MKKKTKHTLTPWMVLNGSPHTLPGTPAVFAESGTLRVATVHGYLGQAQANAEFIVRACNLHDELVESARALVRAKDMGKGMPFGFPELADATDKARKVLAKLEGK